MGDFRKIVKQLRMLGISIKIESSRLGDGGNEFFKLGKMWITFIKSAISRKIFLKSQ